MKSYIAKLVQGSDRPELVVELENSIGEVTYSRIEEGRFRLTCEGAFTDEAKISGLRQRQYLESGSYFRLYWDDEGETQGNSLILETYNALGVLSDNILSVTEIRFAVYE